MTFTVLGAGGFVGSHLVRHLHEQGAVCFAPGRDDPSIFSRALGHVIYCIGLTADFRDRPFDTVEAHVCLLQQILRRARFESLLYLSSTRVYRGLASADEDSPLAVDPQNPDDLYNLSKLTGEALCLASGRAARVARLSNVYGPGMPQENFLAAVTRDAVARHAVRLRTAPAAAKDYVSVDDVVPLLAGIAVAGRKRVYNVASGSNVSNAALMAGLQKLTGCAVSMAEDAPAPLFPPISIERARREFGFAPAGLMDNLASLVAHLKEELIACD